MAMKTNKDVAVDREAISAVHQFAIAYAGQIDEAKKNIAPIVAFLTDNENISGGDSDAYKDIVNDVYKHISDMKEKVDGFVEITSNLCNMLGENAASHKVTIQQAKENLVGAVMKVKQATKA